MKLIKISFMKTKYFFLILLLSLNLPLFSQNIIGDWATHLPFSTARNIVEVGNKIYCSTQSGLFVLNTEDETIEKISRSQGLAGFDITALAYSESNNTLIIGYRDGDIDLLTSQGVFNIPDIKRKQMSGYKSINNVLVINNIAYLSCAFGIVVLDISKKEIADTYFIGENGNYLYVYDITLFHNKLFAATDEGILFADADNPFLVDYTNWSRVNHLPVENATYSQIEAIDNKLITNLHYSNIADTVYIFDETSYQILNPELVDINRITAVENGFLLSSLFHVFCYNFEYQNYKTIWNYNFDSPRPKDAIMDKNGIIWIADSKYSLVKSINSYTFQSFYPNGPAFPTATDISIANNIVWVAGGTITDPWARRGAYIYNDNFWTNINETTLPELNTVLNIQCVTINPQNTTQVFAGSWGYGVVEFENNEVKNIFTDANSPLRNIPNYSEFYIRVPDIAMDKDQNLWVLQSNIEDPLFMRTQSGEWFNFDFMTNIFSPSSTTKQLLVTKDDNKWILNDGQGMFFVFNENKTYSDETDDLGRSFSLMNSEGKLISSTLNCMTEDNNGDIWVGTANGISVFYSTESVFDETRPFVAQQIITYNEEGEPHYLLETETITDIAVDGGNRKWVATENAGVFLLSENGTEQIANFTTENSPLISNFVQKIDINHQTGDVFFGTNDGIVVYRAEAIQGETSFSHVYAYPNPVRENYEGNIVITGLVGGANLKITDIAGNLVYETEALGGRAIWDGKSFSGERVQTGVYLVFCANEDGTKTAITKILFIN